MGSNIFPYLVITSMSGVLTLALGLYAYIKRNSLNSSGIFTWMISLSCIYIFGHAFELSSHTLAEATRWIQFQYLGMPFIPPCCLIFIIQYLRLNHHLTLPKRISLFVIPTTTTLLVLSNDYHHLFYRSIYARSGTSTLLIDVEIGQWYIIHGCYTFGCLLFAAGLLLWNLFQVQKEYRKQTAILLLNVTLPITASFSYLLGYVPKGMDPVPITMAFTSSLYLWAMTSKNLLQTIPIARERIFDTMQDGVVVLNLDNTILDYNAAGAAAFAYIKPLAIGLSLPSLFSGDFPRWLQETEYEGERQLGDRHYRISCRPMCQPVHGEHFGTLLTLADITEEHQLRMQLEKQAFTDGLTNIYNRAYFMKQAPYLLQKCLQNGQPFSLILFDIDFFKKVNDTYGHHTGDLALQHVADICKQGLRNNLLLARYGGEEFIICLPATTLQEAAAIAEQVRYSIESRPLLIDRGTLKVTASFGAAQALKNTELTALLDAADTALYQAKRNGRNQVILAAIKEEEFVQ